ncbi:MAG: DNA/RNA nuclease SfsA [Planctomycetota bacterium]
MRLPEPLLPGRLLRRYQRFLADVRLDDGSEVTAHCPNPGSMLGCLRVGGRVLLSRSANPKRKLACTWELARVGRIWVGVNTLRTNRIVEEALRRGRVAELRGYESIRAEAPLGERRRIDFLLKSAGKRCYVEVKNVTLVEGRTALFPDSVTTRGRAHLEELATAVLSGHRSIMLYLVNRPDAEAAAPAREIDPDYAETLADAVERGVETLAYRVRAGKRGITLSERIPFHVHG